MYTIFESMINTYTKKNKSKICLQYRYLRIEDVVKEKGNIKDIVF
jgi:hypothetical protein